MTAEFKYRAFISYSHADETWAKWLHQRLERYRVPSRLIGKIGPKGPVPKRIGRCFRDQAELSAASHLGETLQQALRESQALIIVCSPRSAVSHWVNEEIKYFRGLGRSDDIYALIVDGAPNAKDPSLECFPPALLRDERGELLHEPLAADARGARDGKDDAFLKLTAALIGVRFDDLRQREQRRRARLLIGSAAASLAIALVTSVLAVSAYRARNEARLQQHRAEEREAQLKQVVDFQAGLLQRVDVQQIGLGWIDGLRAHISAALHADPRMKPEQIETALADFDRERPLANAADLARETLGRFLLEPEDKEIGDRFAADPRTEASLRMSLGESYAALGLPRDAHHQFDRIVELRSREPSADDRVLLLARMERGDVDITDGNGKAGLAELRAVAATLHQSAGDGDPDTLKADIRLVQALLITGDYIGAEKLAVQLVPRATATLGADDPLTLQTEHAYASTLRMQSRYKDSETMLQKVLAARVRVIGPEADDTINTLSELGNVQLALGENAAALATEQRIVEICTRTKGAGHPWTLRLESDLANVLAAMNDLAGAGAVEEKVMAMQRQELGDEHPETLRTMLNHADTLMLQNDFAGARDLLRKVVDARSRLLGPDNPRTLYAMDSLSKALRGLGDNKGSLELVQTVYDKFTQSIGADDERTLETESDLSTTLFRLGRVDEARAHGRHALAGYVRVIGANGAATIDTLNAYAKGLCDAGFGSELITVDATPGKPASEYCSGKT